MGYMLNNPLSFTDAVLHPYIWLSFVERLVLSFGASLAYCLWVRSDVTKFLLGPQRPTQVSRGGSRWGYFKQPPILHRFSPSSLHLFVLCWKTSKENRDFITTCCYQQARQYLVLSCSVECNGSSSYVKKKVVSQVLYFGDRFQKLPRLLDFDMFIDIMRIMRKVQQE